jgi:hypothetical protein
LLLGRDLLHQGIEAYFSEAKTLKSRKEKKTRGKKAHVLITWEINWCPLAS